MPIIGKFDSNYFQTPDFRTEMSRQSELSYPEIQLNYEPSFMNSNDQDRCAFYPELTMSLRSSCYNNTNMALKQESFEQLNKLKSKFSFEDLEKKASLNLKEFSRMALDVNQSTQQNRAPERKLTKYSAIALYQNADANIPSLHFNLSQELKLEIQQEKELVKEQVSDKSTKNSKKKIVVKRRRNNKYKDVKQKMLEKSSNNIFSTFSLQLNDLSAFYPGLAQMSQLKQKSTFPKVFASLDQPTKAVQKKTKNNKANPSFDSDSTRLSKDDQCFSEVTSTIIRSKVDNLKGSMLCFQMSNNLKEMLELSKCVKWQRRREYRTEMAKNGLDEFTEEDSMSEEDC